MASYEYCRDRGDYFKVVGLAESSSTSGSAYVRVDMFCYFQVVT